ncbi:hypothetical protein LQ939_04890 [Pantoea alhagi]|uniref:hypothetical protein n=1 Tax=Pantoea alhagi TaxID=1891675 RepID=UPI00202B9B9D|nr:hypothetical protein [Pantoea alhagi]URQ61660.1 hypothetical protein LQ939_04890 [Pantoea alhagi]
MNNVECNGLSAENPDLSRFYKSRSRDSSLIDMAKKMLVYGMSPGKVSLLLRLNPEFVAELAKTWNHKFRKVKYTSQYAIKRTVRQYFDSGAMLEKICADLQLPLFSVITFLQRDGVSDQEIASRMPVSDDPLFIEYRKTISRKQAAPQRRSPRLHY